MAMGMHFDRLSGPPHRVRTAASRAVPIVELAVCALVAPLLGLVFVLAWMAELAQTGKWPTRIDETGD